MAAASASAGAAGAAPPAASGELPHFPTPLVKVNHGSWGPTSLPEKFSRVPYAPYTKNDRLGRVADFSSRQRRYDRERAERNGDFDGSGDDEDEEFTTVDTVKAARKFDARRPRYRPQRPVAIKGGGYDEKERAVMAGRKQVNNTFNNRKTKLQRARYAGTRRRWDTPRITRKESVMVEADWDLLEQVELSQLTKLKAMPPAASDLRWTGRLDAYDDSWDRVTTKTAQRLKRCEDREFYYEGSLDDPVMQETARDGTGNVFATDSILAHLMTSPRAVFPWDIVVTYASGKIFFDVRDPAMFDRHSVNETAHEPPNEDDDSDMNGQTRLSLEATAINQNFSQQVLKSGADGAAETKSSDASSDSGRKMEANPFWDEEDSEFAAPASVAYRYRLFKLGDDIDLVARTTVNAVSHKGGREALMTVFALNEWNSRAFGAQEWSKIIDGQRGAVMATELKNNSMKMAKWTAQTLLAGADQMKIGFVSRNHAADPHNHMILGTHMYMPTEFAHQVSLSENNMWGIFRWLVDLIRKKVAEEAGEGGDVAKVAAKFVLVKDPNAPSLRLFKVPFDWGESSDEDDDDDEGAAAGAGAD